MSLCRKALNFYFQRRRLYSSEPSYVSPYGFGFNLRFQHLMSTDAQDPALWEAALEDYPVTWWGVQKPEQDVTWKQGLGGELEPEPDPVLHGLTFSAYKALVRDRSRRSRSLKPPEYLFLLKEAATSTEWTNAILRDILSFEGPSVEQTFLLMEFVSTGSLSRVEGHLLLQILRRLDCAAPGKAVFSKGSIEQLIRNFSLDLPPSDADPDLVEFILPHLLHRISSIPTPNRTRSQAPQIMSVAFLFIEKLGKLRMHEEGLQVFTKLVEKKFIPDECIIAPTPEETPALPSEAFRIIALSSLVRAALHWKRVALAMKILQGMLPLDPSEVDAPPRQGSFPQVSLHPLVSQLTIDTIYSIITLPPRPEDVPALSRILLSFHNFAPIPDPVLRAFYALTAKAGYGNAARDLYVFTRTPSVFLRHRYPPPQGPAVLFILESLAGPSTGPLSFLESTTKESSEASKMHYARILVKEVANGDVFLPLQIRARFIALSAACGLAGPARIMWERYSTGQYASAVLGNSKVLLRLVSSFVQLARRIEKLWSSTSNHEPRRPFQFKTFEISDVGTLSEAHLDFMAFARKVVEKFCETHEPLDDADHKLLSSLARAYFILGDLERGYNVFRLLLRRKEIPDLVDINIILGQLAEANPRSAAAMIERMVHRGVQPDALTFGSVIHWAGKHGDVQLLNKFMRRMHAINGGFQLDLKTMLSLLRSVVQLDYHESYLSRDEQLTRLIDVHNLLESVRNAGLTFHQEFAMGKLLVHASLRLKDGGLADQFWQLLCRGSESPNHRDQQRMRQLIDHELKKSDSRLGEAKESV